MNPELVYFLIVSLVNYAAAVKPTLYLNENVYLLGGSGSISDPYIIGM